MMKVGITATVTGVPKKLNMASQKAVSHAVTAPRDVIVAFDQYLLKVVRARLTLSRSIRMDQNTAIAQDLSSARTASTLKLFRRL